MTASKPPFWSRPLVPLLLGVGACAACCAAPLAAILVGAGVAGTLGAVFEPIAGVMLAAAVVLAGVIFLRRRRAAADQAAASCETTGACAIDRSCGCGPSAVDQVRELGCTLEERDMPKRLDDFRELFGRGLKRRSFNDGRAEWIFAWSPTLEADARALAAAEQGCCSFFEFDIQRRGDELHWVTNAPQAKQEAVALMDGIARATMATPSARA